MRIVIQRQNAFARHATDLWTAFHPNTVHEGCGNEHFDAIYEAMEEKFPTHTLRRILWTFFGSKTPSPPIDERYWVGAGYARGATRHARILNELGGGGLIMAPCNPRRPGANEITSRILRQTRTAIEVLSRHGGATDGS